MSIRAYRSSDFQSILKIYADSKLDELRFENAHFDFIPLDQDLIRLLRFKESDVYVFDQDGVVAYCALSGSHIESIFVHSDVRRKGIARTLLEFLLSKIKGDVSLNVAKNNFLAKNLYLEYGFKVESEFSTSYNGVTAVANRMVRH